MSEMDELIKAVRELPNERHLLADVVRIRDLAERCVDRENEIADLKADIASLTRSREAYRSVSQSALAKVEKLEAELEGLREGEQGQV